MKIQQILFFSLCTAFLLLSCDKTESFDDQWKSENEAQFASISNNAGYTRLNALNSNGYIMYKELAKGDGETAPLANDRVKILYTGWFKYDWSKGDTYTDSQGNIIHNKEVFDTTDKNNIPYNTYVYSLIDGFSTALQYMHVGDKWEIWIPWKLGYGETVSGKIRAHTTLVFEVELVSILDQ